MRPVVAALKFFYRVTVPRSWKTLQAIRLPKSNKIPKVLIPQRCWQLIEATEVYLHLTRNGDQKGRQIVAQIMNGPGDEEDLS